MYIIFFLANSSALSDIIKCEMADNHTCYITDSRGVPINRVGLVCHVDNYGFSDLHNRDTKAYVHNEVIEIYPKINMIKSRDTVDGGGPGNETIKRCGITICLVSDNDCIAKGKNNYEESRPARPAEPSFDD